MTIAYLRSHSYENDGRLARYLQICKKFDVDFIVFDWERNVLTQQEHSKPWRKPFLYRAKVGAGIKNIFNLFLWNCHLLATLIRHKEQYRFIHAVDLDTVIPALIVSRLFNKHLIFDVYDKYSASRSMPKPLIKIFDWVESKAIENAQDVIVPHICRVEQLGINKLSLKNAVHIFENIPYIASDAKSQTSNPLLDICTSFRQKYQICLAYVGILETKHRGLENLLKAVSEMPNIGLIVAGAGELSDMFKQASELYENIIFVGKVKPDFAHCILNAADVHIGFYYTSIPNHLYASPNKYYEHLYYGKALLTNKSVPPGSLVDKYETGFSIDETYMSLKECLSSMCLDEINKIGRNARGVWDEKYANYQSCMEKEYCKILLLANAY